MENDVAPFNVLSNLLEGIELEYLKVFFPRRNLGAGKWRSFQSVSGVITVNTIISYEIVTKLGGTRLFKHL